MKHILFPVDFSDPCAAAAETVAAVARRYEAGVTLLHVVRLPQLRTELAPYQHHFKTVMEEIEGALRDYRRELWDGLDVEAVLREGEPARVIVEYTRYEGVDLVMMPTRGQTRFRQLLLGSVTASVLHDVECPVWTSAHAEELGPFEADRPMVCAVDLGPATVGVLRTAHGFAARFGADVRVVHVSSNGDALAQCAAMAVEAGLPRDTAIEVIEDAAPVEAILDAVNHDRAGLLVIGRGRMQGPLGRLRTRAHELIRRSRCPVLSV